MQGATSRISIAGALCVCGRRLAGCSCARLLPTAVGGLQCGICGASVTGRAAAPLRVAQPSYRFLCLVHRHLVPCTSSSDCMTTTKPTHVVPLWTPTTASASPAAVAAVCQVCLWPCCCPRFKTSAVVVRACMRLSLHGACRCCCMHGRHGRSDHHCDSFPYIYGLSVVAVGVGVNVMHVWDKKRLCDGSAVSVQGCIAVV